MPFVEKLAKKGIESNFKDNKVIVWCCNKTVEIFEELNKKYKLKLALPKGIFVEDFTKLDIDNKDMYGLCNWFPSRIIKDSSKVFPERTVFFNSFNKKLSIVSKNNRWLYQWQNIDAITDKAYKSHFTSTDHFLNFFIHEFCHSAHNSHLLDIYPPEKLLYKLLRMTDEKFIQQYQEIYGKEISKISVHALCNPLEAISNDMTLKITNTLSESELLPTKNPFKNSLYPKSNIFSSIKLIKSAPKDELTRNKTLKRIWYGQNII